MTNAEMTGRVATTLAGRILSALSPSHDRPFLLGPGTTLTRHDFLARVAARQRQLREQGIGPGSRLLVLAGDDSGFWADLVAVWGLGAVAAPASGSLEARRLEPLIELVDPQAVIGVRPAVLPANRVWLPEPNPGVPSTPIAERNPDGLAAILFTSGSTGLAKAVETDDRALLANVDATLERVGLDEGDVLFIAIPFNFFSAILHFLAASLRGAAFHADPRRLVGAELYLALEQSNATCFGGAPGQLRWIADCAAERPVPLRWVLSSGDHLPVDVIRRLRANLPKTDILTVYGMTELGGRFCILDPAMVDAHMGSVGTPIRGLGYRILDDAGRPAPAGTEGEVCAFGETVMRGYRRNADATSRTLTVDGLRTGDLGYVDAQGLLRLTGRADDVFKCQGQKVSTALIAQALMETGLFSDVAVLGWDDPHLGTVPRVFYVLAGAGRLDQAT
ncbi:MAG: long-chain fatty acid--CoA ligase, partial [Rhodospirillales bacterium]|nr:long-chain fatty acid--CoA ligase [Rhodospirillales bacterium]